MPAYENDIVKMIMIDMMNKETSDVKLTTMHAISTLDRIQVFDKRYQSS